METQGLGVTTHGSITATLLTKEVNFTICISQSLNPTFRSHVMDCLQPISLAGLLMKLVLFLSVSKLLDSTRAGPNSPNFFCSIFTLLATLLVCAMSSRTLWMLADTLFAALFSSTMRSLSRSCGTSSVRLLTVVQNKTR